jgi:hypothetical protein
MKRAIIYAVLAFTIVSLVCAAVPARLHAEKYEKLYDLFEDIKGWKGKDPEGVAMEMPGMKMLQATRNYAKGENEINAMIIIGNSAMTGAFTGQGVMKYESEKGKAASQEIDGFMVYTMYDKKKRSGAVTVVLLPNEEGGALFVLAFEGLGDEEGFEIAKGYDWKKMKKRIESLD